MGLARILLIAVGLSMDAFAVSVCKGLSMQRITLKKAGIIGAYFGFFQALMPLLGYLVGKSLYAQISAFDHWIAFGLLAFIGIKMIRESRSSECPTESLEVKQMLMLSIATSLDALAVGLTFALLGGNIVSSCLIIGATTLLLCMLGVKIGHLFGEKLKTYAELAGGIILICIGVEILIEHLIG